MTIDAAATVYKFSMRLTKAKPGKVWRQEGFFHRHDASMADFADWLFDVCQNDG